MHHSTNTLFPTLTKGGKKLVHAFYPRNENHMFPGPCSNSSLVSKYYSNGVDSFRQRCDFETQPKSEREGKDVHVCSPLVRFNLLCPATGYTREMI